MRLTDVVLLKRAKQIVQWSAEVMPEVSQGQLEETREVIRALERAIGELAKPTTPTCVST